ncbi:hypothetical protein HMPREF3156_01376 [Neisseria sp. HMSC06F02]|nr:hypothetical protein HMPREF3156_01376 [Neisseria sp. HMSC06F02]
MGCAHEICYLKNPNQTTAEWTSISAFISRAKPMLPVAATATCPFPRLAGEG